MTIDEAIGLLTCAKEGFPVENVEPYYKAMELGIEALKQLKLLRAMAAFQSQDLLPGETEK